MKKNTIQEDLEGFIDIYMHINDHVNDFHDDNVWHFVVTCHFGEKDGGHNKYDWCWWSRQCYKRFLRLYLDTQNFLRLVSVLYMYYFQFEVK